MRGFIAILICLGLAACNTPPRPHPLVVPSPFQTPQPFAEDRPNSELLSSITETASITLAPIEGLEGTDPLLNEIARVAQEADIPLSLIRRSRSADLLRGQYTQVGSEGRINWIFETADGAVIDAFDVGAPLSHTNWPAAIAEATANRLAQAVDARPLTAARLAGIPGASSIQGPPVLVPNVIGAPGDGNTSLTRAVRSLLENAEVNVVNPDRPPESFELSGSYTLQGTVDLGAPLPEGGQPIAIAWDLYTNDGQHLGNVAQQTLIEPGSLDGAWGEVAIYAAMGATEGIMTLLAEVPPAAH